MWECLHWPFCPGVFIAALGVVAAIAAFRKDPKRWETLLWIGAFTALMISEVWMLGKDRAKSDEDRAAVNRTQLQNFNDISEGIKTVIRNSDENFNKTMTHYRNMNQSIKTLGTQAHVDSQEIQLEMTAVARMKAAEIPPQTATAAKVEPLPVPESPEIQALRVQGLQLAKNMNDWIAEVSQEAPKGTDLLTESAYRERLNNEFKERFVPQANDMVNKLHIRGLRLACIALNSSYQSSFILGLRKTCADRLEGAALNAK